MSRLPLLALLLVVAGAGSAFAAGAAESELMDRVSAAVEEAMARDSVPGISIGIRRGAELLIARGYGLADVENQVPATERTVYRIGSVTKQFTAAAILLLEERGKLGLGDDVRDYVPQFPTHGHRVSIERLLNHTAGIKGYTEMPEFWSRMRDDLEAAQMLELFGAAPPEFAPGERWQYSNSGYYLLGLVIERVSGRGYDEFMRTEIFDRLGLGDTTYLDDRPVVRNRAEGYEVAGGEIVNDAYISMKTPFAAGALGSSVVDLLRWQRALAAGELVRPDTWRRMSTPGKLAGGEALSYGYGVGVGVLAGRHKIAHGGGINGFRSQLAFYPEEDLTIAVLTNSGAANPGALESRLARIVLGLPEPVVAEIELGAEAAAIYAGIYDPGRSPIAVVSREGALWLFGRRLRPVAEHRFVMDGDPDQEVSFEVAEGRAVALRLEREGQVTTASRMERSPPTQN